MTTSFKDSARTSAFEEISAGFRILGLRSDEVEVRCAPELGGRIFSLVSRQSKREWLWRQPGMGLFSPRDPTDFTTGTFAGLDECCPTVGACKWKDGQPLNDHGNIWASPWKIDAHTATGIDLSARMENLGLKFSRSVSLARGVIRFSYALENFGLSISPALWSMHPLFRIYEGDRLSLPDSLKELVVESIAPSIKSYSVRENSVTADSGRPLLTFPEIAPGVRLDRLELTDMKAGYLKCFGREPLTVAPVVTLSNDSGGDRLRVSWSQENAPYLGLWLTRGGYRGWHQVAIEPCQAPYDQVSIAAEKSVCGDLTVLKPGETRQWWVQWAIEQK